nr:MAG TPA: hypothetical protein [Caudoviricetes sp.]
MMSIVYVHFYVFCLWFTACVKFAFLPYVLKLIYLRCMLVCMLNV